MLKRIISAIIAGLKSIGRLMRGVAAAPFLALNSLMGGGAADAPPVPATSAEDDDAAPQNPSEDLTRVYGQIALAVMQWCVDSVVVDQPALVPTKIPRGVAAWLPGLNREECLALACANVKGISAHLRNYELIDGVRSVRPLDRVEWVPESDLSAGHGPGIVPSVPSHEGTEPSATKAPAP